ncbi:MAG: pyridoxal-phosphate dependent enzyme [Candidatus Solibacter usitatus]|nr:pyridoxal-phosphate dependent enzyme [Candidatus Solibacter usitatus]
MKRLIAEAAAYLAGKVLETPVEYSRALSERAGVPVWLKLEHLQRTGSFKLRGAWFRLSKLSASECERGVMTCSAGNHGKAVAYAARELNVRAVVCVPSSVDAVKLAGMRALGAEVRVSSFAGYDDTEEWAREQAEQEALPFLSAFDDPYIMAGNGGTLAAEVARQLTGAVHFLLPVGGGGLAAGFVSYMDRGIIGCQLQASPALELSLRKGSAVTRLPAVETIAGGLEGGIGRGPFEIMKSHVEQVALISEDELKDAMRFFVAEHQYLIEPSAAVTIAALLTGKAGALRGPVCAVTSGRNVSINTLRSVM